MMISKLLAGGSHQHTKPTLDHHLLHLHCIRIKVLSLSYELCFTGSLQPDSIRVWIVGSSIIKRASIAARSRPGGLSLGLTQRGINIWWQGYGGLKFMHLVAKIRHLANFEDRPKYMLIHCGANDLGQVRLANLLHKIKFDIELLASIFPHTTIIWSFLLPRILWRHSQKTRALEQARNRVNRFAAAQVFRCGGKILLHPQFVHKPPQLYHKDGTHLSPLGNDIFLNNVQGALEYFASGGVGKEFPAKLGKNL
jgi:lysophospholipase L1-like esterase